MSGGSAQNILKLKAKNRAGVHENSYICWEKHSARLGGGTAAVHWVNNVHAAFLFRDLGVTHAFRE